MFIKSRCSTPAASSPLYPASEGAGAKLRSRRAFLSLLLVSPVPLALAAAGKPAPTRVVLWKEKTCGCCGDWIKHLEANGFEVTSHDSGNTAMRARLGIPAEYGSCHTAMIEGYAIEGHVPAADIRRLLRERPQAVGLAAPGMPIGSPGMDGPAYNGRRTPYDVLLVARNGKASVFQSHR